VGPQTDVDKPTTDFYAPTLIAGAHPGDNPPGQMRRTIIPAQAFRHG
jgi:hypothetical protein